MFLNSFILDNYMVLGTVLIMFFFFIMILLISFDAYSKRKFIYKSSDASNYYSSGSSLDFKNDQSDFDHSEPPETMFYRASHDLKSPLKTIQGLAQLGLKDDDKTHQRLYLDKINETAIQLEDFISEVLDLGKIKRKKLQVKSLLVKKLINECIQSFELYPDRKKVRIRFEYEPNLKVTSDENLLRSIFTNLIENAIKYRDESKGHCQITISAYQHKNIINLNISDNGIGIGSEQLPYIFDLFYRVDSKNEGSGLGLYIVKESVRRLKACIKAYSEKGKGSMFILEIPSHPQSAEKEMMKDSIQRLN